MTLNKNLYKKVHKKISISPFTVDVLILYYHQFYFFSTIVYLSHNVVKVVKKRRTKKLSIWYPEQFCVSWNCFGCKDTTRIFYFFFCVSLKYGKRKKMESWMILLLYLPHFHSVLDKIFVMLHSIFFCPSVSISFLQWYDENEDDIIHRISRKYMYFKVKGKNFMSCWCNLAALCKRRWIEIIGSKHDNVFHLILCYFILGILNWGKWLNKLFDCLCYRFV